MPRRRRVFSSAREAKEDNGSSRRNRSSTRRPAMLCGYCGPHRVLPHGYDYWETRYRCLQKGFGAGKFNERRKWQAETGQPVDPDYPSQCPHVMRSERRGARRAGIRARRGSRSSRYSSSSSDDDSSDEHKRPVRKARKTKLNKSRRVNIRGSRSYRRRVSVDIYETD